MARGTPPLLVPLPSFLPRLLSLLLLFCAAAAAALPDRSLDVEGAESSSEVASQLHSEEAEGGSEDPYAVLFPWFVQALGIVVFYIMTRYVHALPYTAIMFVFGTLMGVGATLNSQGTGENYQLSESIRLWFGINGEVMLLVFLPGLLFWDALNVNWFLFTVSIYQLLIMAFPMVLAGTALTACVGSYVFPYDWSFLLSMTFGSILAATDPVAVAALLNEVGAPPRLKMHITGESMLNDGSAVVFFTVFLKQFLAELGIISTEEAFTVGEGFALFFRMALGGAAIGLAFGICLIFIWFKLPNYLNREENIMQVVASITAAYLSFYTSEMVCHMSGIVAVILCGVTARAFGGGMINKPQLMENFWHLVEHILNTLLFTLGGIHWGHIITRNFKGSDWGYLFLLYVLLHVIRFFLFFAHFPILSRIGLKTTWQETFFTSYAGLRGAVGIALALALNNEVYEETGRHNLDANGNVDADGLQAREYTDKIFGMVGGISFLTLVINGTTSGKVLKMLGLTKVSETREEILDRFDSVIKNQGVDFMVDLLTESRFSMVDFAVIRHHMPFLKNLTAIELREAVHRHKESVPAAFYKPPNIRNIIPYLDDWNFGVTREIDRSFMFSAPEQLSCIAEGKDEAEETKIFDDQSENHPENFDELIQELRHAFLDLLRAAYEEEVTSGELDPRENGGFLVHVLEQSVEFASAAVSKGGPLQDWEAAHIESDAFNDHVEVRFRVLLAKIRQRCCSICPSQRGAIPSQSDGLIDGSSRATSDDYRQMRIEVFKAFAFIQAHRMAQERLEASFGGEDKFRAPVKIVLKESEAQVNLAEEMLLSYNEVDVRALLSHLFCKILLHRFSGNLDNLTASGVLKEKETHVYQHRILLSLRGIEFCSESTHPDEKSEDLTQDLKSEDNLSGVLKQMKLESQHSTRTSLRIKESFRLSVMESPEGLGSN